MMMIKNYDKSEEFILNANLVIYHCKDEKQLSLSSYLLIPILINTLLTSSDTKF